MTCDAHAQPYLFIYHAKYFVYVPYFEYFTWYPIVYFIDKLDNAESMKYIQQRTGPSQSKSATTCA